MDTKSLLSVAGLSLALLLGIVGCRSETKVYNTPEAESGTVDDADAKVRVRDDDASIRVRGDRTGDGDVELDDPGDVDVDID